MFFLFGAIDFYSPKPQKTQVRTYLKAYDTHSLQGQKCQIRTPFLTGPYPIFMLCKRACSAIFANSVMIV